MDYDKVFAKQIKPYVSAHSLIWRAKKITTESLFDSQGRAVILSFDLLGPTQYYWVDPSPAANWAHYVIYVGIDCQGTIYKQLAEWPPDNKILFEKME